MNQEDERESMFHVAWRPCYQEAAELARTISIHLKCQTEIRKANTSNHCAVLAPASLKEAIRSNEAVDLLFQIFEFEDYESQDDEKKWAEDDAYQQSVENNSAMYQREIEAETEGSRVSRLGDDRDDWLDV